MTIPDAPSFARLPDRALIRLRGPDWRSFLQGLVTQDVETMAQGEIRYAALLTPQGRLLHDIFVIAESEGEGAWLDVAAQTRDALLARLKMYRLRAKVELESVAGELVACWGAQAPLSDPRWRRDPRLAALGWRGVDLDPAEGATTDDYERHRLALGVADIVRDGLGDKTYALEANLDLLNGVDFRKGCFVGQETTSRMKRRSVVKSRMMPLRFEGPPPPPGSEVLNGPLRAGVVHSGVEGLALGLMRLDRAVGAALTVATRSIRLDPPAWTAAAVQEALAEPAS